MLDALSFKFARNVFSGLMSADEEGPLVGVTMPCPSSGKLSSASWGASFPLLFFISQKPRMPGKRFSKAKQSHVGDGDGVVMTSAVSWSFDHTGFENGVGARVLC